MDITDVKIRLLEKDKLKAVASVTFENCLVVHDIKVIESNKALFIAMPSRKGKDGEYKDIAHPINAEMRKILSEKVLSNYYTVIQQQEEAEQCAVED